jgi:hypothetical protein
MGLALQARYLPRPPILPKNFRRKRTKVSSQIEDLEGIPEQVTRRLYEGEDFVKTGIAYGPSRI